MQHVHDPSPDRLHQDLGPFPLQESEHVKVPVALGGLRPELAGDLHNGLDPQAVHFNLVKSVPHVVQGLYIVVAQDLVQEFAHVGARVSDLGEVPEVALQVPVELPRTLLAHHLVHVVHHFFQHRLGLSPL